MALISQLLSLNSSAEKIETQNIFKGSGPGLLLSAIFFITAPSVSHPFSRRGKTQSDFQLPHLIKKHLAFYYQMFFILFNPLLHLCVTSQSKGFARRAPFSIQQKTDKRCIKQKMRLLRFRIDNNVKKYLGFVPLWFLSLSLSLFLLHTLAQFSLPLIFSQCFFS